MYKCLLVMYTSLPLPRGNKLSSHTSFLMSDILVFFCFTKKIHNRAAFALTKVRNTLLNCKGGKSMYKSHFKNFEGQLPCELLSVRPSVSMIYIYIYIYIHTHTHTHPHTHTHTHMKSHLLKSVRFSFNTTVNCF